ncbi:MAG: hypothetical protein ABIA67_06705 [Candidatus Margulisiibacteriota bacterium]
MSILMNGISNAQALTAQINGLQSLSESNLDDPEVLKYALEQNFNKMLNDLISSTNDDEDDEEKNDPFSFFTSSNQASLQSLQAQGILDNAGDQAPVDIINALPDTSSAGYLNSLYDLGQFV